MHNMSKMYEMGKKMFFLHHWDFHVLDLALEPSLHISFGLNDGINATFVEPQSVLCWHKPFIS